MPRRGFWNASPIPVILCLVLSCDGSGPSVDPPLALTKIVAGFNRTCALTGEDVAYCWGKPIPGTPGIDPSCAGVECYRTRPDTLSLGLGFQDLRLAANIFGDAVCGISPDSQAYCWGVLLVGFDGGLDIGSTPQPLEPPSPLTSIRVASRHFCGLTAAGQAHCWGDYRGGVRGTGESVGEFATPDLVPNPVAGGFTFTQLALGLGNSCGLDPAGAAYCWGSSVALGNTEAPLSSEEECGFTVPPFHTSCSHLPVAVAGGHSFQQIAAGQGHVCGLTAGGEAYCWGTNELGELGTGDTVYAATPVPAGLPEPAGSIALGSRFTCALGVSGQAYCWGESSAGQIGSGSITLSVPVPTAVAGGGSYRSITAGNDHACALRLTGELDCWGGNWLGQLGTGDIENSAVPREVEF